ncbi:MAG TPA: aminotransferase class I/II-fold pyridoxal phosphate-dependent enzyme [Candidatus Dormibacteraeota bacterium]|nr:aminotransferase class I/II-fold pyridoxal phosphate-dependent enzyme [Candidatus Dormibacteraeota bacterium]
MSDGDGWGISTRALHVGQGPDPATGAVVQPIHLATTYRQESVGVHQGFEYSRSGNPTRNALEECLASLERARHCLAFASGLAATTTLLLLLEPGDHVVVNDDVYGGTARLFTRVLARYGLRFDSADLRDPGSLEDAITDRTRMVWLESPTNPLLRLVDIAAVAGIARGHGALTVVDNTFATPVLQNPLVLGADAVVHSSTKYLGGHSDVVGGAVMLDDDALAESLRFHQNAVGAVPSPFDCWLLLRGVKTLALRVREQCASARTIAEWLSAHPAVQVVHYPGLPSHPQHALALHQMGAGGGMVSFEVASEERALEVLSRLRVVLLAESLGAVESLAEHPPRMTHASIPAEQRRRVGIGDGLIRLSVGVEDVADLLADLDRALD